MVSVASLPAPLYEAVLAAPGADRVAVMAELRRLAAVTPAGARDALARAPVVLGVGVRPEAERLADRFRAAGAGVEVRQCPVDPPWCADRSLLRPAAAAPGWLTPTVTGLAHAIRADGAFDRLPVLADALEEAGCGDPVVLGHCRAGGAHDGRCWVVDLVLGTE